MPSKQDTPTQSEIRQVMYSMPFMGGQDMCFPEQGGMTWEVMLHNVQVIRTKLESIARDHVAMVNELDKNRRLIDGVRAFFAEVLPNHSVDVHFDSRSLDVRLQELIKSQRIIEAIKLRRAETGEGLKEAKDYVDKLRGR